MKRSASSRRMNVSTASPSGYVDNRESSTASDDGVQPPYAWDALEFVFAAFVEREP
jgi:hypothetical protein